MFSTEYRDISSCAIADRQTHYLFSIFFASATNESNLMKRALYPLF